MSIALAAFNVTGGNANTLAMTGAFSSMTSVGTGQVDFAFESEQEDEFYQIGFSSDAHIIHWDVRNRSTTGFSLELRHNGEAYDPSSLCVVTVDR